MSALFRTNPNKNPIYKCDNATIDLRQVVAVYLSFVDSWITVYVRLAYGSDIHVLSKSGANVTSAIECFNKLTIVWEEFNSPS